MEVRRIVRNGNSWAINFPRRFLVSAGLTLGDHVMMTVVSDKLFIKKLPAKTDEPKDRTFGSYRRTRF